MMAPKIEVRDIVAPESSGQRFGRQLVHRLSDYKHAKPSLESISPHEGSLADEACIRPFKRAQCPRNLPTLLEPREPRRSLIAHGPEAALLAAREVLHERAEIYGRV